MTIKILLCSVLVLFFDPAEAGNRDLRDAKQKADSYQGRGEDFLRLQELARIKREDKEPVRKLLQERRKAEAEHEQARRSYVVAKKRIKRTGDRGFAKDLREKQDFNRRRAAELGDYVRGIYMIRDAVKEYRTQVDEMDEVGLQQMKSDDSTLRVRGR